MLSSHKSGASAFQVRAGRVVILLAAVAACSSFATNTSQCTQHVDGNAVRAAFVAGEMSFLACSPHQAISDEAVTRCRVALVRAPVAESCRQKSDLALARCETLVRLSDTAIATYGNAEQDVCVLEARDAMLRSILSVQRAGRAVDIKRGGER
jgi:hypothetical protein